MNEPCSQNTCVLVFVAIKFSSSVFLHSAMHITTVHKVELIIYELEKMFKKKQCQSKYTADILICKPVKIYAILFSPCCDLETHQSVTLLLCRYYCSFAASCHLLSSSLLTAL